MAKSHSWRVADSKWIRSRSAHFLRLWESLPALLIPKKMSVICRLTFQRPGQKVLAEQLTYIYQMIQWHIFR